MRDVGSKEKGIAKRGALEPEIAKDLSVEEML